MYCVMGLFPSWLVVQLMLMYRLPFLIDHVEIPRKIRRLCVFSIATKMKKKKGGVFVSHC